MKAITAEKNSEKSKFDIKELWRAQRQTLIPFIALAAVIIIFQIASEGKVLTERNMKAILNEGFFTIIGAIGLAFVIAQGNLDFSMGGNLGISCALAVTVSLINPWLALPVGVLSGTLIGLLNGAIHAKLHVNSFIATLSVNLILTGMIIVILDSGSLGVPYEMLTWDNITTKSIVLVVVAVIGFVVFSYTKTGKWVKAVGAKEAAEQSGINVARTKIIGFMIAGGVVGFLAYFNIVRTGSASSMTGAGFEMDALSALLLGGMPLTGGTNSKFRSAVIGGLTMTFLSNGMTMCGIGGELQQLARGIVFLLAVALTFDRKNIPVIK